MVDDPNSIDEAAIHALLDRDPPRICGKISVIGALEHTGTADEVLACYISFQCPTGCCVSNYAMTREDALQIADSINNMMLAIKRRMH